MEAKIPLAFAAGLLSFATPCVLPLVPGYLAAVSGARGGVGGRRVLVASLPFVAGFTAVFVGLGAAAAAAGGLFAENQRLLLAVAGLVIVVLGFAFMGLLPFPWLERLVAPELVEGARASGSAAPPRRRLRGLRRALRRAGPRHDPRARERGADRRAGHAPAPRLLGRARAPVPGGRPRLRPLARRVPLARDRYAVLRVVSGALLVAIGLLLFFDRFWWLRVARQPRASSSSASACEDWDMAAADGTRLGGIELRNAGGRVALGLDLREERGDVEAAVRGRVGPQAPRGLLELALAADAVAASGLVPGDGDVDEPLEEVALRRVGRSPGVLESLVGGEVLAAPDELEPALESADDFHLAVLDDDLEGLEHERAVELVLARAHVVLPAVPGAGDHAAARAPRGPAGPPGAGTGPGCVEDAVDVVERELPLAGLRRSAAVPGGSPRRARR